MTRGVREGSDVFWCTHEGVTLGWTHRNTEKLAPKQTKSKHGPFYNSVKSSLKGLFYLLLCHREIKQQSMRFPLRHILPRLCARLIGHRSTLPEDITLWLCGFYYFFFHIYIYLFFCRRLRWNPHCTKTSGLIKMNERTAYFHPVLIFVCMCTSQLKTWPAAAWSGHDCSVVCYGKIWQRGLRRCRAACISLVLSVSPGRKEKQVV